MERADLLPLPATWDGQYVKDESRLQLVLEHYDREQLPLRRYVGFLGVDAEKRRARLCKKAFCGYTNICSKAATRHTYVAGYIA